MNERFAELLAKGPLGQLTPAETEELVRLLNGPILDPLENPPPQFVSDRSFAPSDIPSRPPRGTTARASSYRSRIGRALFTTCSSR